MSAVKQIALVPADIDARRVSYNGITSASQADDDGSIPFTRSTSPSTDHCGKVEPRRADDSLPPHTPARLTPKRQAA